MKKVLYAAPAMLLALCVAGTSLAGGPNCGSGDKAEATTAKVASASAKGAGGAHCEGMEGAKASMAMKECGVKANQVMYSYAVPSVTCDGCVENISKAALAKNGIHCAHVDLSSKTAYFIVDKKMSKNDVSKVMTAAGYKNKFTASGDKAVKSFHAAFASGEKSVACCSKDRV
ncbi:MAG TPA: heavy metal-associated domain-containing protein [Candidatus Eisenbacteria bacterium]|nr:heavy metal-associated domain-containing protein [Candidatus Eisenbacteria bacterium]